MRESSLPQWSSSSRRWGRKLWSSCRSWSVGPWHTSWWQSWAAWLQHHCQCDKQKFSHSFLSKPSIHHCLDKHGLLHFLKHNAFGVRSSTEGVGLQSGAQMGLLVLFIVPFLYTAVVPQFSSSTQSTTLAWRRKKRKTRKKDQIFPQNCSNTQHPTHLDRFTFETPNNLQL